MSNEYIRHSIHSGSLNLFERRKSRHCWWECWAVLGSNSLRLFTNHESFLNASEEPKLIQLTADTFCESVHINGKNCQFKICSGDTFMFKCESESVRQEWLAKLGMVLSGFCRNNCFHCNGKYAGISITSDNGSTHRSRQNSEDKMYSLAGEIIQGTFNSECTNTQRNSTGCEDHITLKSPLKIYDTEENVFSSFNKTDKKARTQSETDAVTVNVNAVQEHLQCNTQVGQSMKSEKSPKNSFGYSFEADNADNITRSSLTLFDTEHKRFSTFSKRSSLKRERPVTQFANPGFVLEDQSFATDGPPIPKTISKVYDAPLNYDVPALSKNDPKRGSLKVLAGKNNWKKYEAVVEENILILSDPESSSSEKNCTCIELKPNIKFTHLPRRNNDYRFKMSTGTSEYFFKTANVMRRDSWIKALTEASTTVCQMGCPRCCTKANRNGPSFNENEASQSDTNVPGVDQWDENADEVFYVGMAKPDEGITFVNSQMDESENVLHSACEGTTTEPGHNEDQQLVSFHSGYLKTNAIGNNWEQYWATITGKKLVLHSSEENLNSLKTMELTQNVQCKTAKRSSYDFRFTLVLSTHECCEFKCATAHGRRQWMTALERAGWGVGQESNAGSKISEIVTKIRENQNKLEEIQHQQQVEKEREKQRQEMELQQQQQQQQQPQIRAENEDFYEVIPAENNLQQQISSPPHHVPQPTPLEKRQQQQNADISQDIYDDVSANDTSQQSLPTAEISAVHRDAEELELTAEDKNQNQPLRNTNDCKDNYKMMTTNNNQQKQQLPPPPQHLPPLTPPQRRQKKQQSQTVGNDLENVDNFVSGNIPQQSLLPPPPQQLPPLTPPQKRHQLQQQQQDSDNGNDTYDDFVTAGNIQKQQLPPPPQQLPPPTPPQERQEQLQLTQEQTPSNAENIGQDVYELIPGDNGKQQNQEELYEIIPAEKNEPQHQQPPPAPAEPQLQQQQQKQKDERQNKQKKHKEKKNKRILPELQTKKQKKEKKKQKGNSDELEQKDQKENEKDKSKQQKQQQQQQQQQAELEQNEDTMEEQNESSWNFEEHVQVLGEVNFTDSIVNEEAQLELKEEGNDMCAAENKSEITCPDEQTAIGESNLTQDVERFLTQVLGKLDNLPDDVNKERLELSKKLQKFLNLPDKSVGKKKPALPPPTVPVKEEVNEVDEGEYGDVASVQAQGEETYDDVVKDVPAGEETYDDVNAKGSTIDDQENYDDVVALSQTGESKSGSSPEPEEMYDDVNTSISAASTKQKSLSRLSNSSLDTKDVGEAKKPSDIKDKIFEGYLDKYKTKGLFTKKWQKRYCVLTPLALYYYENPKDQRQKGQIILPSSGSTLRDGCESFPDVKDKKLCFELVNNDRSFLFKVGKESELDVWKQHIKAALQTDLSDEQSKLMRQKSFKISGHDDDEMEDGEELYECIDTMQQTGSASNAAEPDEELYELTDQFAPSKETSASSSEAPAVPSRDKTPPEKPSTAPPAHAQEEEEFEKMDDDGMEDYQLPDASAPKPGSQKASSGSPTLPTRPSSTHDAPNLPPRVPKSTPGSQKPPELPTRTTPSTAKKTPPELPIRTTPTLTKKSPSPPADEPESFPPPPPSLLEPEPGPEPKETAPPPVKAKTKPGEKFDYNRVYVALWNCNSDDEDDLEFSRGNYLYIREKIPNSDWWVASLMDIPDIRVGLVPRNYIMPAYDL